MMLKLTDLKVLGDNVLVEPLGEPEKVGSLFLPETAVGASQSRGVVVAAGPGETLPNGQRRPLGVAAGDLVFYSKYAGFPLTLGGVEYQLIPEPACALAYPAALESLVVRHTTGTLYLADEQPPTEEDVDPGRETDEVVPIDINRILPPI
jgi:chaperonin GroES